MSSQRLMALPVQSMADEQVQIRVSAVPSLQQVTLRLISDIGRHYCIESHATFTADQVGNVDVGKQEPVSGLYAGVDPMGLFWTQQRTAKSQISQSTLALMQTKQPRSPLANKEYLLTLEIDDRVVESVQFERQVLSPEVSRLPIRESGLVATLFHHKDNHPRPGIIFWGGSNGGMVETPAALMANHGFTTLSLAYFGMESLPAELVNVPLEYIKSAIDWFMAQAVVRKEPGIGIYGGSRGGELALLVASTFSEVKAAVSVCGSGLIMEGHHRTRDFRFPAWTYEGRSLPDIHKGKSPEESVSTLDWKQFQEFYADNVAHATIPVERIQGAVLMFSGGQDRIWNSTELTTVSMSRFQEHQFSYPYAHIVYPEAGHGIWLPYAPAPMDMNRFGGTLKAKADASVDAWKRTVDFFSNNLLKCGFNHWNVPLNKGARLQ